MSYTKGPWSLYVKKRNGTESQTLTGASCYEEEYVAVVGCDGEVICDNANFYPVAVTKENARLISAAPDLLEALQQARKLLELAKLVTVEQVINAGDDAINAAGLNPYCLNEGRCPKDAMAIDSWKLDFIDDAISKALGK